VSSCLLNTHTPDAAAVQYEVYVEGLTGPLANPKVSQRSNVRRFVTSAAGAPAAEARAQGATAGVVEVRGPNVGTWDEYELMLCALRTGTCKKVACDKAPSDPTTCSLTGLDDDSLYSVQVRCCCVLVGGLAGQAAGSNVVLDSGERNAD